MIHIASGRVKRYHSLCSGSQVNRLRDRYEVFLEPPFLYMSTVYSPQLRHRPASGFFENTLVIWDTVHVLIELLNSPVAVPLFQPCEEVTCGLISSIPFVTATLLPMWWAEAGA
jgi:hypothetical protein